MADDFTVDFRKACNCRGAPASGPRVFMGPTKVLSETVQCTAFMTPLVCHGCDTPWVRVGSSPEGGEQP